jgi:hypothetical protein
MPIPKISKLGKFVKKSKFNAGIVASKIGR